MTNGMKRSDEMCTFGMFISGDLRMGEDVSAAFCEKSYLNPWNDLVADDPRIIDSQTTLEGDLYREGQFY